jgi:CheY-like chemotaxis protein
MELAAEQVFRLGLPETKTAEVLNTIYELSESCTFSSELLENLVLYEKVEKGTVVTYPEEVEVMSLLLESFKARTAIGVKVNFLSSDRGDPEDLAGVVVDADKKLLCAQILKLFNRCWRGGTDSDRVFVDAKLVSGPNQPRPRYPYRFRNRTYPREPISSDTLRLQMTLVKPLDEYEMEALDSDRLTFSREASEDGGGGFVLVAWNSRHILKQHGGSLGHIGDSVLFMDIPCRRVYNDNSMSSGDADYLLDVQAAFAKMSEKSASGFDILLSRRLSDLQFSGKSNKQSNPTSAKVSVRRMGFSRKGSRSTSSRHRDRKNESLEVLVVDDSKLNRKMQIKVMSALGLTCLDEAENGQQAVDLIKAAMEQGRTYFAVLLDNEMPVMRGRDAVKEMRAMGYRGVVLGVTGNVLQEDIDDFKACGTDDVILKPFTPLKFKDVMAKYKESGALYAAVEPSVLDAD